jgi:hypothetical protein
MQCVECLDGWSGGGWGVFIALNHQFNRWGGCFRWAHRTVRCATGQVLFTVWCASGGCSDFWANCPRTVALQSTVALASHCFASAPDNPVNYSEERSQKPEGEEFGVVRPWCTGHCPVPQTRVLFGFFCSFLLNPNLIFLLVCVEPLAPVEYII